MKVVLVPLFDQRFVDLARIVVIRAERHRFKLGFKLKHLNCHGKGDSGGRRLRKPVLAGCNGRERDGVSAV